VAQVGVLVVAERIKDLFLSSCGDDIAVCPIILRKIGKREAKLPTPMPSTGEPEDIINEVPLLSDMAGVGPYFQIIPLNESDYPRDRLPASTCSGCHLVDMKVVYPWDAKIRMTADMWRGTACSISAAHY
jgi:hypothetical protein